LPTVFKLTVTVGGGQGEVVPRSAEIGLPGATFGGMNTGVQTVVAASA
jgi:hypothetical protein